MQPAKYKCLTENQFYRDIETPNYLTKNEVEKLERGEVANVEKLITDEEG